MTESTYQYTDGFLPDPVGSKSHATYDDYLASRWSALDARDTVIAGDEMSFLAQWGGVSDGMQLNPYAWDRQRLAAFCMHAMQRQVQWLPRAEARAVARIELADYLERVVLPAVTEPQLRERLRIVAAKLRTARGWAELKYSPTEGKFLCCWEQQADSALLCPDESNEEFQRLRLRYIDRMVEWAESGKRIYSLVLTAPHAEPGKLHETMRDRMKEAKRLLDSFPQIKGSMLVMESPLAALRRWNVHVNVLILADDYLPYDLVRQRWKWNLRVRLLWQTTHDEEYRPLTELRGTREEIEATLRELIKYAVRTLPDKSSDPAKHAKALAEGRIPAPAMIEYTAAEWLEWWYAHRRFRRTRTYGVLYRLKKPEPQSVEGFVPVGQVVRQGRNYFIRSPLFEAAYRQVRTLLNSIQRDNFPGARHTSTSNSDRGASNRARGPPD